MGFVVVIVPLGQVFPQVLSHPCLYLSTCLLHQNHVTLATDSVFKYSALALNL